MSTQNQNISSDQIVGLILAGGKSTRMNGNNKALLKLGNSTLIEHVIMRLKNDLDTIILNANEKPDVFSAYNLPLVKDTIVGFAGPLAGVLSAMQWAKQNKPSAKYILSVAADTPFFPTVYAATMQNAMNTNEAHENQIAIVKDEDYWQPTFGLWPISLANELEYFLLNSDVKKVMAFAKQHPLLGVAFEKPENVDPFFNINTPQDLAKAESILRENK
ncbi:MAG: molybdenum cofactor guanylyltransferase MobA [Nitratireductor sp.]